MSQIMMQLGSFQFQLSTAVYQEFQRNTAYTWAALPRFGQDDALQATGPGSDTITLPGVIFPEFMGGTQQVIAMRAMAAKMLPLSMVDGRGFMMGDWVIEGVDERGTIFAQRGVALRQEFVLKLRRAPDDGGLLAAFLASPAATVFIPTPDLMAGAKALASTTQTASGGALATVQSSLATVTGFVSDLRDKASTVISAVNKGVSAAKTLQNAGKDAARLISSVKSVTGLPSALNGLVSIGGNVSRATGSASSLLKSAGIDLGDTSVNPAAIKAVRDSMVAINQVNVLAVQVRTAAQKLIKRV